MNTKMIGERIRFIRINKLNLCQNDLAKIMEIDRTYLSRIESGKQNLTVEMLIRICEKGLGISVKDFFDFEKIDF